MNTCKTCTNVLHCTKISTMYKEPKEVYSIRTDPETIKEIKRVAKKKGERPRTFANQALKRGLEILSLEGVSVKSLKSKQ